MLRLEGAPRGPLIGQSIASIADRAQHRVDGQAAGAFEKRAPFRDARVSIAGSGGASGDWRSWGMLFLHPLRGSFLGYRGSARRPTPTESANPAPSTSAPAGPFGTDLVSDA